MVHLIFSNSCVQCSNVRSYSANIRTRKHGAEKKNKEHSNIEHFWFQKIPNIRTLEPITIRTLANKWTSNNQIFDPWRTFEHRRFRFSKNGEHYWTFEHEWSMFGGSWSKRSSQTARTFFLCQFKRVSQNLCWLYFHHITLIGFYELCKMLIWPL